MSRFFRRLVLVAALAALASGQGATKSLLILHTNDLHDHVRPGPNGTGGLPYVSGYVRQVRAERSDVLLLDAGDVAEKGDLVAFRSHSALTYEGLRRIGYDAVTIGNHEFDEYGVAGLRSFESLLGRRLLNLNVLGPDGAPLFEASRLVEVNGLKVGLIGLIVPRKPEQGGLDFADSGRALAAETARLRATGAHLIVAVCHESAKKCAEWSRAAPDVNVFVSGHSHQAMAAPEVVPETGAIIVQAGHYARWVGRLELEVDPAARKVVKHTGRLVPMKHADIPVDAEMLAWVQARERELAPEADDFVFENPAEIDGFSVARLAAEALRLAAGADIGFCHPYQIIRDILPAGRVDVNALFMTGGQRGHATVLVELTGAEVEAYVNALQFIQREPPEWAGFRAARVAAPQGGERLRAELDAGRLYRVVLPLLEWETRFLRLAEKEGKRDPGHPLARRRITPQPSDVNFTQAVRSYITSIIADGGSVQGRIKELERRRETIP